MISKKHSEASRRNILKAIESGKSVHKMEKNGRWNGGNRTVGIYPCPVCKKELKREKRYSSMKCVDCGRKNQKPRKLRDDVKRPAYYYRARKMITDSGIKLTPDDHVHHKNGDWTDNRLENLEVISKHNHRRKYHNKHSPDYVS